MDSVYNEIQKDLLPSIYVSSMMARDTFVRDWLLNGEQDSAKIVRYLKEIQEKYGTVVSFLVSENSRMYYRPDGIFRKILPQDPDNAWYFRVSKLSTQYEVNLDSDVNLHNILTVFINYRVTDYQNKLIGVTGVGLPVSKLGELIDHYQARYQSTVYFTDLQGHVIVQGKAGKLHDIHSIAGLSEQVDTILGQKETVSSYSRDGHIYQLNVRLLPEFGWYLFVEKSEDESLMKLRQMLLLNLAIGILVGAIVLWLTNLTFRHCQAKD